MLVGPFEVQVRRPPSAGLEHRRITHARFKPDVQDVPFLLEFHAAATGAGCTPGHQCGCRLFEPDVGALSIHDRSNVLDDRRLSHDFVACRAGKGGNRDAPYPLTRETPVWAIRDHSVDAVLAPGRNPPHTIDLRQGLLPQFVDVHRDEPLFGRAEDDRVLAAPAVRIRVGERTMAQEPAFCPEHVHDGRIRFEDLLPGKFRHGISKAPGVIHRRQDLQPFPYRGFRIVFQHEQIVFHAMSGRNMHTAGALLQRHKITEQHR